MVIPNPMGREKLQVLMPVRFEAKASEQPDE
jgi:hypothetical protein